MKVAEELSATFSFVKEQCYNFFATLASNIR
jgi:hypothetical protein